jgi:hypothetical protein
MDEPVFLTLWVARFVLPPVLRAKYGTELLTEQIKSITGLDVDKLPDKVQQNYRNTTREFMGTVTNTVIEFDSNFEVNVDEEGIMYPLNIIKDWSRLIWDNNTAAQSLKRDYAGQLTLESHTKSGDVTRRIECGIIFPSTPVNAFDFEYNNEAIYQMSVTWTAEKVSDLTRQISGE